MDTFSPEQIEEIIAIGRTYIPIVEQAIDEMAPVLDKLVTRLATYAREQNVASI